jgi:hypothetical protein
VLPRGARILLLHLHALFDAISLTRTQLDQIPLADLTTWVQAGFKDFPLAKDTDSPLCPITGRQTIDEFIACMYSYLSKFLEGDAKALECEECIKRQDMEKILEVMDECMENQQEIARQHRILRATARKEKLEEERKTSGGRI